MSKFRKLIQEKAKEIGCATLLFQAILSIISIVIIIICALHVPEVYGRPKEEPSEPTTTSTTTTTTTAKAEEVKVVLCAVYDVPLSADLQRHITETCEAKGIDPTIIFAMIERETNYDADAIGDGGESYGIMQIKAKYHYERMLDLNCTDLLDPYQNVTVGVDILCELLSKYGDTEMALCAYNAGCGGAYEHYFSKGVYSSGYSRAVMERANELKGGVTYAVQR